MASRCMDLYAGHRGEITPRTGYAEMRSIRDHVAELEQIERTFVRNDGGLLAESEPGGENVFARGRRVLAVTIEAATDAEESSALDMVGEQGPTVPVRARLLGGEVAALPRGDLKEPNRSGLEEDSFRRLRDLTSLIHQIILEV